MIMQATKKLMNRENLSAEESRAVMEQIMTAQASPAQMAAYLTALNLKGETSDEILGSAQAMRDKVQRITHKQKKLFDNCGTGGDGSGTFNISTTTSFILAGYGLAVAKHGNRSITSQCGSADLLQALGACIDLTPEQVGECIDQIGIGFLFAPNLHPAMKNVAPVRKELGFRTIFNILGPLTNPAFATHQLIGVFDSSYTEKLAIVAKKLGMVATYVVYNLMHVDELTTAGPNKVSVAENGSASSFLLNPEDIGFGACQLSDLKGGTAEENAKITLAVLGGEKGPRRDTVLLNAGVALLVSDEAGSIKEGVALAADCIDNNKALAKLNDFIEYTKSFGNA
jgi:anthranilate phosphoribosyltransferase